MNVIVTCKKFIKEFSFKIISKKSYYYFGITQLTQLYDISFSLLTNFYKKKKEFQLIFSK